MLVRFVQPENAKTQMSVTLSPIVTLLSPMHSENTLFLMVVTLAGIFTLLKL